MPRSIPITGPIVCSVTARRWAGRAGRWKRWATPGHTSNHICLALPEQAVLFSGDHVMGWSTTIVSPPDGDMGAYMASLERLLGRSETVYFPAHGPQIDDPQDYVRYLIGHRRQREAQILRHLAVGEGRIAVIVSHIYEQLDPSLHPARRARCWPT